MSYSDDIDAQAEALLATDSMLRWRPTLMSAVLRMKKPSEVVATMKAVDPLFFAGKSAKAAIAKTRRLLQQTRLRMGLEVPLPTSACEKNNPGKNRPGKPTDAQIEEYRRLYCVPWIEQNGGFPRRQQLIDLGWDQRPQLPQLEPQDQPKKSVPKPNFGKPSLAGAAISKKNSGKTSSETIGVSVTDPTAHAISHEETSGAYPEIEASLKNEGSMKPSVRRAQPTRIAIGLPKKPKPSS